MIVHTSHYLTLVGGGEVGPADLDIALRLAPGLVAADGGADVVHAAGLRPIAVIGDMDSLSPQTRAAFADVLHEIPEQDTTDLEKCLTRIAAPAILAIGFLGGRIDHTFSALTILARQPGGIVALGPQDAIAAVPEAGLRLDLPPGTRLSLLPLCNSKVWSSGLRWNLAGEPMSPTGFMSVSNEVLGPIRMRAEGSVLLVLPRDCLQDLWAAVINA